jgi:glycosyltransferase involved in cell wall biosynthesis
VTVPLHLLPGLDLRVGGMRVYANSPFIVRVALLAASIMRSDRPADMLLVRNLKLAEFLIRHRRLLRLPPVIFEAHEVFIVCLEDEMKINGRHDPQKLARLEARERHVYERSDGLICTNSYIASTIRERYGIDKPLLVLPNGVDLAAFPATAAAAGSKVEPTVLFIGSLHHWKGIDILLQAVQRLPGVRAKIVGGNDSTIKCYSDMALELGIADRVHFDGYVVPARRFECMSEADVFILPLRAMSMGGLFTSPLKLFEYMAAGKPIVASDLPATRELLTDGVNAVLVEPESPDALAQGIRGVLENPALGMRLAAQASVDVRRYTWAERARSLIEFAGRDLAKH